MSGSSRCRPRRRCSPHDEYGADLADAATEAGQDPRDYATSARNRLSGAVERIDRRETVATVAVDVGTDRPLLAPVTTDSLERLALAPGVDVVATWKATATRAVGHTPV